MNTPLWFSNLLFWSAQVTLLALAAAFLQRLLQLRQPRVLLAYWRALLALSLLLPFLQPWHRISTFSMILTAEDVANFHATAAASPAVSHWHFPTLDLIAPILGALILAGIAVRFAILALGLLKLRQFRRSSSSLSSLAQTSALLETARARVGTRAEFRLSSGVDSPVTFGFAAPIILLPERFPSLDPQFQSAIACHELLHVRRHDWAHHLFEEVVRALFWFHPAIAWLISRVRLAREQVVDLEVVKLTNARKPYLEALLAFTNARAAISAIPAPPFLVERQLAERVALMLKEVRMSRTRLIASLTAISCCIALAVVLAVWAFPLKAAPRSPQNPPQAGAAQGVSGGVAEGVSRGVTGGVSNGVSGGVSDGISRGVGSSGTASRGDIPTVYNNTIWIDTVKRGPMVRQVRGLGTLATEDSTKLIAKVMLPESMTKEVHANQTAAVSSEKGPLAAGHVISVGREVIDGQVAVDIALDETPRNFTIGGATPERIDATIDIEKIDNVLHVGRPVHGTQNSTVTLFKIVKDGTEAVRVDVKLGRASVTTIEILDGLKEGDKIILSDMAQYNTADRIHIK